MSWSFSKTYWSTRPPRSNPCDVCQDQSGNWYGWGKVLDYIGVKWKNPELYVEAKRQAEAVEQMTMEGL